ncbi:hypothetical protein CXF68_13500 [Tenacibaculum sp. Bg11-29]|uniref:DUF6438 domain-containing protein n=1 Tax=Tenacibaculum sp. Bg11-29 TaxID=2058306 RepID=UPI000C34B882|nr:DUF6438 domain-containing protein [Tenacibaculum sp. Bg11-29]PKH51634.1 hypothetical protein CXF68_13500 [Tenacibaculum sp. Bg11-29]
MRYLLLLSFALTLACSVPKKETKIKSTKIEEKKVILKKTVDIPKTIENELIVIFKNPKNIEGAKSLIEDSGLSFQKMVYDKNTSKIGVITVPEGKRAFWLEKLKKTNAFKLVNINTDKTVSNLIKIEENTLVSIKKTPCSGDCAVYELSIDKQGNVIYKGIKYVLKEGKHEFKLSEKEFEKLNTMFSAKGFENFKDEYDDPSIVGLANTFITYNDKQVKIRLWRDIPDELINIHEYIESILLNKKMIE